MSIRRLLHRATTESGRRRLASVLMLIAAFGWLLAYANGCLLPERIHEGMAGMTIVDCPVAKCTQAQSPASASAERLALTPTVPGVLALALLIGLVVYPAVASPGRRSRPPLSVWIVRPPGLRFHRLRI